MRDFSLDLFSLAGRTAVVTGGNSGLGQAFTLALSRAGADVYAPSVVDDHDETRSLVEDCGRRLEVVDVDLTETGAADRVVTGCLETFGALDILVNSAGTCRRAPVADFGREDWDAMVALNLTAAFELARAASRPMVAAGSGKIVNIASLFSFLGGRDSPAYAATKAGIAGFTRAYCDELAGSGVQVNALAPGYVDTAMTAATSADPESRRRITDHIPAGRWAEPGDLMGALVFLCSPASDYVNGHILTVDGGYLVR